MRFQLINTHATLKRTLENQCQFLVNSLDVQHNDPVELVMILQKRHRDAAQQLAGVQQEMQQLREYSLGLERWREILKQSDTLFGAPGVPDDLRHNLTHDLVPLMSEHLVKRQFEGLKDWETFRKNVEDITQPFSDWQTAGNKRFSEVKDEYIHLLREIRVGQIALRARYEYGADHDSYHDLYSETA